MRRGAVVDPRAELAGAIQAVEPRGQHRVHHVDRIVPERPAAARRVGKRAAARLLDLEREVHRARRLAGIDVELVIGEQVRRIAIGPRARRTGVEQRASAPRARGRQPGVERVEHREVVLQLELDRHVGLELRGPPRGRIRRVVIGIFLSRPGRAGGQHRDQRRVDRRAAHPVDLRAKRRRRREVGVGIARIARVDPGIAGAAAERAEHGNTREPHVTTPRGSSPTRRPWCWSRR